MNFTDFQFIKAQKDCVKNDSGEKIGNFIFLLENNLVNKLSIGYRYIVTGIYILDDMFINVRNTEKNIESIKLNKNPIFKIVGIFPISFKENLLLKKEFLFLNKNFFSFARSSKVYDWIYSLILPDIYERTQIKQSIACMLFGGITKFFANNYRFRGEINIIFLYNQSDSKNKFLDFFRSIFKIDSNENDQINMIKHPNLIEIKDFPKNKVYAFTSNFFSNLILLYIEDFGRLDSEKKIKIIQMIKRQLFYKTQIKICSDYTDFSFIFMIDMKTFQDNSLFTSENSLKSYYSVFSKFDFLCLINKDHTVYERSDLTRFKISCYNNKNKYFKIDRISSYKNTVDIFLKYIEFARVNFNPKLSKNAAKLLKKAYTHLRIIQSKKDRVKISLFTWINISKLESIIRISESLTKMRMSDVIECNDILDSIRIVQEAINTILEM
jgi:DNA replicative helicase MCM subunit Mcm2 (Cdc46/Mcm family)